MYVIIHIKKIARYDIYFSIHNLIIYFFFISKNINTQSADAPVHIRERKC